jgi:hypothetical protein
VIAAERCGVPVEKCHTIMEKYGYTGSACIPNLKIGELFTRDDQARPP